MKRLISLMLCVAMLASMLTFTVSADTATTKIYGDTAVFSADFDAASPTPVLSDTDFVSIDSSLDGNAVTIVPDTSAKKGVSYSTNSFSLSDETIIKFDLIAVDKPLYLYMEVWDKDGNGKVLRIKKSYLTGSTLYTYVVKLSGTAYTASRKTADGSWEAATVDNMGVANGTAGTNTFRIMSSYSANAGSWILDNIEIYEKTPFSQIIMDKNPAEKALKTRLEEKFEGTAYFYESVDASIADAVSVTKPSDNASNNVLDVDLSKLTAAQVAALNARQGTIKGKLFDLPDVTKGYTVSFDFRRVTTGAAGEQLWVQTSLDKGNQYTCIKVNMSLFDVGVWYTINYSVSGDGVNKTILTATATNKTTGVTEELAVLWATGWTGNHGRFLVNSYNASATAANRGTNHWQMDNILVTNEELPLIKAKLIANEATGGVVPVIAAYDAENRLTGFVAGEQSTLAQGFAGMDYDITAQLEKFKDAKSVKVHWWDGYQTAKPYTDAVEIGNAISSQNKTSEETSEIITLTDAMQPSGVTGDYTALAYTVPFTTSQRNIPAYDPSLHTMLAFSQQNGKFTSIKYLSSLYDSQTQDIVVVTSGKGATAAKITLLEENQPPAFTNTVMHLGSDLSERIFTWFSLDNGAGKVTYAKYADLIDGKLPANAKIATATRDHEDTEYSFKEFYYNNKATITGLEPDTKYCYQFSNGEEKSELYTFTTGDDDSSFSFVFAGDPQIGRNAATPDLKDEHAIWGRTLKQMANDPRFAGADFLMSAGDNINSRENQDEEEYDALLNHDIFKSFPLMIALGNHDGRDGGHHQHFAFPNLSDYAGVQTDQVNQTDAFIGADYYLVYNSVLFLVLNNDDFVDDSGSAEDRAFDREIADKHIQFIDEALEATKDNKDILWRVVLWHRNPYGSSYHNEYLKNDSGVYNRLEQYAYTNLREYMVPALYERDIDVVFSGHDHCYTRSHIIKPAKDANGNYIDESIITGYNGAYTYEDGTTTPTYTSWADLNDVTYNNLKVSSKPVKVTNPDGILHITGATASGSQVNSVAYENHYAAVALKANTRHLSNIEITPTTFTINVYNLGTNVTENITLVDTFTIERTAEVKVQGVSIDPASAEIPVGQTKTLTHKLSPAQPDNSNVSWDSDNKAVATVDQNGVVTALSKGTANITVTTEDGGHKAVCAVTVIDEVKVESVTVTPSTLELYVGDIKTISASVLPETATTKEVIWSSSDEKIATVSSNGSITAVKEGNATITATSVEGGKTGSCALTVKYIPATKRVISKTSLTMKVMEKDQLVVTIEPENATYTNVTWSSSAADIVSVDQNGNIKAVKPGTAVISATTGEGALTCNVTVNGGITFVQSMEDATQNTFLEVPTWDDTAWSRKQEADGNWVLNMDGSKITANYSNMYVTQIESKMDEVKIPGSGFVLDFDFKRDSADGHKGINIRVYDENSVRYLYHIKTGSFEVGEWYDIKIVQQGGNPTGYSGYMKKASDKTWTPMVYSTHILTGKYISTGSYYNYMAFAVYEESQKATLSLEEAQKTQYRFDNIQIYADVTATNVALSDSSVTLDAGETKILSPVFTPGNATDTHIVWETSNAKVATVDRYGKVTAIGKGTATIKATSVATGAVVSCAVTVNGVDPEITLSKTANGTKWDFAVGSAGISDGDTVYVGMYNANNALISVGVAPYSVSGNTISLEQDSSAKYFKAFIWSDKNAPCAPFKRIEN